VADWQSLVCTENLDPRNGDEARQGFWRKNRKFYQSKLKLSLDEVFGTHSLAQLRLSLS
jgi:hypothetical protein